MVAICEATVKPALRFQTAGLPCAGDPLICGMVEDCAACDAVDTLHWPHLSRPGQGEHNAIAATFNEQLARTLQLKPAKPYDQEEIRRLAASLMEHEDILAPVLEEMLSPIMAKIAAKAVRAAQTQSHNGRQNGTLSAAS